MLIIQIAALAVTLNLEIAIVCLNLGAQVHEKRKMLWLTVFFAVMHVIVASAGYFVGDLLSGFFGTLSKYLSTALLVGVGLRILIASFTGENKSLSQTNTLLILLGAAIEDFAAGVSVGLGTFGGALLKLILLLFAVSIPINLLALKIGRSLKRRINKSMDYITGLLLIAIGILNLFEFS